MEHFVYILYSRSKDAYYVGESHDTYQRLIKHNEHAYNAKSFTKIAKDWEISLNFSCSSKDDALFLEKFIKRMKSRKFILKLIANPEILLDILNKK